jgi:hypothetical protein
MALDDTAAMRAKNLLTALNIRALREEFFLKLMLSRAKNRHTALPPLGLAATLPVCSKRCAQITTTLGLVP